MKKIVKLLNTVNSVRLIRILVSSYNLQLLNHTAAMKSNIVIKDKYLHIY